MGGCLCYLLLKVGRFNPSTQENDESATLNLRRGNTMRNSKIARAWLMGASLAALSGVAFAQQAPVAAEEAQPEAEEEVVIVTATKREQTLQSVPVAVSVTSADTINKAQVRDLNDLQTLVPSLRVSTNQSSANSTFIIRGFGNGANNAGIEPSVAVFIDGVYRSRAGSAIGDLPNLQRVEVLRGPQSTLFGKNASAGVISVVTRKPKFEWGGSGEVSYGNFNALVLKGDITGPINDKAAFAVAGGYNVRDGYVKDLGTGALVNDRNRYFVRGDLLIEASDNLSVRALLDYDHLDEVCCAVGNVLDGPASNAIRAIGGKIRSNAPFSDEQYTDVVPSNVIDNAGFSVQIDYERGNLNFTSISAYRTSDSSQLQDVDFTSSRLATVPEAKKIDTLTQEFRVASDYEGPVNFLLGAYIFKENIDQTSAVVYGADFRNYALALSGGAASPLPGLEAALGLPSGTFQRAGTGINEAMRMENNATSIFGTVDFKFNDALTLTGGFNHTRDNKRFELNVQSTDVFSGLDLNAIGVGLVQPAVVAQQVGGALQLGRSATAAEVNAFRTAQPAIFAQINAGATQFAVANANNPAVNQLLGLRVLQFQPPFLNIPNAVEPGRTNDENTTFSLRLAWTINDNFNAYASYATGFKASSVNLSRDSRPTSADFTPGNPITNPAPSRIRSAGLAVTNLSTGTRFAGPEESTVMEIGVKGAFPKGAFNLTLFNQEIEDFQVNVFSGTGFRLDNAGLQTSRGIEFDATYRPIRPLVLSVALTYLDPKYEEYKNSSFGDLSGETPAGISPFSYNLGATYTQALANGGRINYRADFFHEDEVQIADGLEPRPSTRITAKQFTREVNLLNGGINYAVGNGWEFTVWGRNLTDERFLTAIFAGVAQDGTVSGYPSQPRTYGASAKYIF
jgi:iron complex outermembrane recepter protein